MIAIALFGSHLGAILLSEKAVVVEAENLLLSEELAQPTGEHEERAARNDGPA